MKQFSIQSFLFLLLVGATGVISAQNGEITPEAEKIAIRDVIAKETKDYYLQDFEAWKSNFVQANYFRQHGYWEGYPDKVRYYNGFDTLQQVKALQFKEDRTYWKGSFEKRYNENFRIFPEVAWYTFEQDSFDGATHQFLGKSIEMRVLEKHDGQWKIAYIGYQYLPLTHAPDN